jgi:carbamate kinase
MGPKVQAACRFAVNSGGAAVIGSLTDIEEIVAGRAGTRICSDVTGLTTT